MSEINDGGQAFPRNIVITGNNNDVDVAEDFGKGMSLRDYFAAQAMSGYCSNADSKNWSPTGIAQDAYAVADAMLFERLVEEVQ